MVLEQKLATMTRKFDSENYKINFFGINFLAIFDNFCSVNSSLLLNQHSFLFVELVLIYDFVFIKPA